MCGRRSPGSIELNSGSPFVPGPTRCTSGPIAPGTSVVAVFAFAYVPKRKTPLQLAALTGVLLLGCQLVLTHWFYLYIPWFFPFVAYATLAPAAPEPRVEPVEQPVRELVATG